MRNKSNYPLIAFFMAALMSFAFNLPAQEPPAMPGPPQVIAISPENTNASTQPDATGKTDGYGAAGMGTAVIQADEETNSVIVVCDDATNAQIQKVIESLDHPVPQVLIKVLFLEITHTDGEDLGIDAQATSGDKKQTVESLFDLSADATGGVYKVIDDDFQMTLRAIANSTKTEVLSRPSVLARNNQQATITVGKEVPIITNSRITENGETINTVTYQDVGIILDVTPHISTDHMVEMDVSPEISSLSAETVQTSPGYDSPVIDKRSAETHVVVADGKTVVIGGMMEDNHTSNIKKVPFIGDIPVIGHLFKHTVLSKTKTELLIFLTPHVVEGAAQLKALSLSEQSKADLAPQAFDGKMLDKYIDNLKK